MKHNVGTAVLAAVLLTAFSGFARAEAPARLTFDQNAPGQIAPGLTAASGQWVVSRETKNGKENGFLAQTQALARSQFAVALQKELGANPDVALQVRVRFDKKSADSSAGIVFRASGESNLVAVLFSLNNQRVVVDRVENGAVRRIDSAGIRLGQGVWHRLQVSVKGDRLTCSVDGQKVLQVRNRDLLASGGYAGLATAGDTTAVFDNWTAAAIPK